MGEEDESDEDEEEEEEEEDEEAGGLECWRSVNTRRSRSEVRLRRGHLTMICGFCRNVSGASLIDPPQLSMPPPTGAHEPCCVATEHTHASSSCVAALSVRNTSG